MILADSPTVQIEPGAVNESTIKEVYRNLLVLYGTRAGEQALDRDFGIDANINDCPQESAQALLAAEYIRKTQRATGKGGPSGVDRRRGADGSDDTKGGDTNWLTSGNWQMCQRSVLLRA